MTHQVTNKEMEQKWHKVIAKAWTDEAFKKRLLSHPNEVLKEHGIEPRPGVTFRVHENSREIHLVIPRKPDRKLSEADLRKVTAATDTSGNSWMCD